MRIGSIAILILLAIASRAPAAEAPRIDYVSLLNRVVDLSRLSDLSNLETVGRASSYDRTGGNADAGYFIREQDGWFVIAELQGPGAIVRTWTADALRWKQGRQTPPRIRIFIDDQQKPALDMPWADMFKGGVFPFLSPWADDKSDCGNSYIPISYQKNCRVELSAKPAYYQLDWVRFPEGTIVEPYPADWTAAVKQAHARVGTILVGDAPPITLAGQPQHIKVDQMLEPGQVFDLADIKGPGALTELMLKTDPAGRAHLRGAVLRMWWDDSPKPSVECPLGDFFGSSPGVNLHRTIALDMTPEGWHCRYVMPFATRGRIQIANESAGALSLSGRIDVLRYLRPEDVPAGRFFAKWRREDPVKSGRADPKDANKFLMMQTAGRGRFVGAVVTVYSRGWNCEGDEAFFIDGEEKASIHGTGYEDFIGQGWGCKNFYHALHGCTYGEHGAYNNHWSTFRQFITEAVTFNKSLKMTVEDYADWNDWSSVCYWYQQLPVDDGFALPPAEKRLPNRYRDNWDKDFVEAEAAFEEGSDRDPRISIVDEGLQDGAAPPAFIQYRAPSNSGRPGQQGYPQHWSGERAVAFRPARPVDRFVIPFDVAKDDVYELVLRFAPNVTPPQVAAAIDTQSVQPTTRPATPKAEYPIRAQLKAGPHQWVLWVYDAADGRGQTAAVVDGWFLRPWRGKP